MNEGRRRVLGLVRVLLLGCGFVLVGALMLFNTAHARLGEGLVGFGEEIIHWANARPGSEPRVLYVNGARLQLMTLSFDEGLGAVVDRFAAHCDTVSGVSVSGEIAQRLGLKGSLTFRQEFQEVGVVACLDTEGANSPLQLLERVKRFTEKGDLSALGDLRYALARKTEDSTHVLSIWSDGPLELASMFPEEGDAPGIDPVGIPRPPGGRRILSGKEQGAPYGVTVYETNGATNWESYLDDLRAHHFQVRQTERAHAVLVLSKSRTAIVSWNAEKRRFSILELA